MATYVNNPQPAEVINFGQPAEEDEPDVVLAPKYEDSTRMIKTYSQFRQIPVKNTFESSGS